jgi:putative addiction module component (TIGR02574 family)
MNAAEIIEQIRRLPKPEQLALIGQLWDEYGDEVFPDPDLSPEQIAELDRRSKELHEHPERGIPAEKAFADIAKKFGFTK